MRFKSYFPALLVLGFLAVSSTQASTPKLMAENLETLEGISLCPDGRLFVTESRKGVLHLLDKDFKSHKSWPLPKALGTLCTSKNRVLVAAYDAGKVYELAPDGPKEIASGLKGPNFLAELPDGRVIFSDSKAGLVYELAAAGPKILLKGLVYPNGLAWVPGLGLAINSTTGQSVWVAKEAIETAKPEKKYSGLLVPDGAVTGPDGALFVAEFGRGQVVRFGADGTKTVVAKGLKSPASLVFGGKVYGEKTLLVTSLMGKGLYVIEKAIP